jgi:hypothetical protein
VIITTEPDDYPIADLQEVASHHRDATSATRKLSKALETIPLLCAELARIRSRLSRTVANLQNLVAAARATLSAQADAEPDPLYYLRDELEAQGHLRPDHREPDHRERP